MTGGKQPLGFTIVEVMIVLAVSGLLFLSAALMIAGKQNRTGFTTSINDLRAEVQQTVNDVINGYYPKFNNFQCTQGSSAPPSISAGSNSQGTNGSLDSNGTLSGCLFLGKAIQFAASSSSSSDPNSPLLEVYPIIGNLEGSNNLPAQTISDADPELLAPGTTQNSGFSNEFTFPYTMEYGLRVDWMCYSTTSTPCSVTNNTAVVAFVASPEGSSSGNSLTPGTEQVDFVPIPSTSLGQPGASMVDTIDNYFTSGGGSGYVINPAGGLNICIVDDTTKQTGLITIGGNGSEPTVNLHVKDNSTDCT